MENRIYRIRGIEEGSLEFMVIDTNEVDPYVPIKELEIQLISPKNDVQHFSFTETELDSLVSYLIEVKHYVKDFNKESQPIKEPQKVSK